jgi:sugar phosphate isomerase/epimerase
MSRPVTLFTGQWADLPLETMCQKAKNFGYDGLELACWGDHMDVFQAAESEKYCADKHALLEKYGLKVWAISNHLAGQLICDPNNDTRSDSISPEEVHGNPEKKRQWGVDSMKAAAKAAKNLGINVVCGFTGSPIWHLLYSFPPNDWDEIDKGYAYFAEMFNPILDVFDECGIKFALEVHPTEIAYDFVTTRRALEAINHREAFGFNFDPSHLQWQGLDPSKFILEFRDRIYHCHMKDCAVMLDGTKGILGSHLTFGEAERGWDFRSPGRGDVDFEAIIRALNEIRYNGPLSVEWEDSGMDREHGAAEACQFVRDIDFPLPEAAFYEAFARD